MATVGPQEEGSVFVIKFCDKKICRQRIRKKIESADVNTVRQGIDVEVLRGVGGNNKYNSPLA